jgi:dTDP-glucose pyrophosphorylase
VTTVVVLAAGAGSRFGAPYPKELHTLRPGVSVIDPLMEAIDAIAIPQLNVVVVVSVTKLAVVRHLARYSRRMAFVLQRPSVEAGLSSALLSAQPWCDPDVLICLGDQVYLTDPMPALTDALTRIHDGAPVAVVAAECSDPDRLRRDGALAVTDGIVAAAAEKPSDPAGFNACWSSLAVAGPMLTTLARDLAAGSTYCLVGAPVVWGPRFCNLNEPADAPSAATAKGGVRQ